MMVTRSLIGLFYQQLAEKNNASKSTRVFKMENRFINLYLGKQKVLT